MSEEEKQEIEASFRAIFNKIKNQLRDEIRQGNTWGKYQLDPRSVLAEGGPVYLLTQPQPKAKDTITTDEIIDFSENLRKMKSLNVQKDLEN